MKNPRILVVRGGAIGDFIMTLPALGALRERWPDAHIEVMGYPHIIELARSQYYADATRSIEAKALAAFFVPGGPLDPALRRYFGSFQLVISYLYDPDRVFAGNVQNCGPGQVVEASPRPADLPAAEHYCKPLERLAIFVTSPRPRVYPSMNDCQAAGRFLALQPRQSLAAIHAGSGSERKNWPVEKFAVICRWLTSELMLRLLVVEGEADRSVVPRLLQLLDPSSCAVVRGLKLTELAAVVQRCSIFLGNDSGVTHLAAAVGTPTVAVFGPVSSPIWEPRGDQVRVVRFGEGDTLAVRQAVEQVWKPSSLVF